MDYNHRLGIDLHIHSTASDGSLTPAEILDHAQKLNLAAIAITDHDSIDGSREALQTGIPPSFHFLTGVEISAAHPLFFAGSGSFHILGYDIRLDDPALNQALNKLRQARQNRNPKIVKRLNELGFQITLKEVSQTVGQVQLGRPHIAYTMMKKGFVRSIDEAFDKFLGTAKPAYVDKERIGCEEAIKMICNAGGIAVLAHPGLLDIADESRLEALVQDLIHLGIGGIEVYYPEHSDEQTKRYQELSKKYNLLMTGGTDYHGSITPEIEMGSGKGRLFIPYLLYEKLTERRNFMDTTDPLNIEKMLGYQFHSKVLLEEALRHSSYVNEQTDLDLRDNERFEFLGDAVLNLVIGHILMERYPHLNEGDLSRIRANLVNETQLAMMARSIELGACLQLGKGEMQTNGKEKNSILAGAFEALMAAVYLDGGFEVAFKTIENNFIPYLDQIPSAIDNSDYKSRLQERVQEKHGDIPNYQIVREEGPDHDKTFWVSVKVFDIEMEGTGKSKKTAEQDAARKVLELLNKAG